MQVSRACKRCGRRILVACYYSVTLNEQRLKEPSRMGLYTAAPDGSQVSAIPFRLTLPLIDPYSKINSYKFPKSKLIISTFATPLVGIIRRRFCSSFVFLSSQLLIMALKRINKVHVVNLFTLLFWLRLVSARSCAVIATHRDWSLRLAPKAACSTDRDRSLSKTFVDVASLLLCYRNWLILDVTRPHHAAPDQLVTLTCSYGMRL